MKQEEKKWISAGRAGGDVGNKRSCQIAFYEVFGGNTVSRGLNEAPNPKESGQPGDHQKDQSYQQRDKIDTPEGQ